MVAAMIKDEAAQLETLTLADKRRVTNICEWIQQGERDWRVGAELHAALLHSKRCLRDLTLAMRDQLGHYSTTPKLVFRMTAILTGMGDKGLCRCVTSDSANVELGRVMYESFAPEKIEAFLRAHYQGTPLLPTPVASLLLAPKVTTRRAAALIGMPHYLLRRLINAYQVPAIRWGVNSCRLLRSDALALRAHWQLIGSTFNTMSRKCGLHPSLIDVVRTQCFANIGERTAPTCALDRNNNITDDRQLSASSVAGL
jgi:hypothetical protein